MDRLRTTILPPKDLVSPSTSMATAPLSPVCRDRSSESMVHTRRGLQNDRNRLADAQLLGTLRDRFDAEHQPRPLLQAVDHGRRELGLGGDEVDARGKSAGAAVASYGN